MSPDWTTMRELEGEEFLADTSAALVYLAEGYIPPDERTRVSAAIASAIHDRGHFELEHKVRRVDGSIGWVQSRAAPIIDETGGITKWLEAASKHHSAQTSGGGGRQSKELRRIALAGGG